MSKTWPAEDVRALAALGQRHFAENRVQELTGKAAELADLPDLRWHLVGQLQRNKAAAVVRLGATVHSVDRLPLVEALDRAAERAGGSWRLRAGRPRWPGGRAGGAWRGAPADVPALADAVATRPGSTARPDGGRTARGGPSARFRPAGRAGRPGPRRPPRRTEHRQA